MKYEKKLNLICRMTGNILSDSELGVELAVELAFDAYGQVEKRLKEEYKQAEEE